MTKGLKFLLKAGIGIAGCVAALGAAQATTLTAIDGNQFNTSWQNIASVSYTFNDANNDNSLNVGELITFTIEMDKQNWGMHAFDALKVWIGSDVVYQNTWDFSTSASQLNGDYSYTSYDLPNKLFSFNYTATGPLDIFASVMCNDDLSRLYDDGVGTTGSLANPSLADWNAWSYGVDRYQGEDKHYNVTPVPEPELYAMFLVGLGLLGFTARRRKDFTA